MKKVNKTTEELMEKQRQDRQQEEQYGNLAGLGWKRFGIAFLVVILAVVIYSVFFR